MEALVKELGLPVALVFALGYFLFKKVWPFVVGRIELGDKERRETLEGFRLALERNADAMEKIAQNITELDAKSGRFCKYDKPRSID